MRLNCLVLLTRWDSRTGYQSIFYTFMLMSHLLCFTIFNPQKNTCEVAVAFLFYKSANQGQRHQERHLRPLVWHPACWKDSFERHDNSFKKWTPSLYCWPWKSSENLQVSLYPLSPIPPTPALKALAILSRLYFLVFFQHCPSRLRSWLS